MTTDSNKRGSKGDILLEMRNIEIDGFSDERWHDIVKGVDLTLAPGRGDGSYRRIRGGKIHPRQGPQWAMHNPGCRIKSGTIMFDGMDLMAATENEKRKLWGSPHCLCGAIGCRFL